MLAVPSLIQSSTALALSPSVLADAASVNTVTTRQTAVAVSAPLSDQRSGDNAQSPPQFFAAAQTQQSNTAPSSAPSAPLTAQILAQEDASNAVVLATSYEPFTPAPQYNALLGYSLVRYKPSDAGIPQQRVAEADAAASEASSSYQAYSTTQSRNQSNLSESTVQLLVAG
jgi:hypothetical protein